MAFDPIISSKAASDEIALWEKYTKKEKRPDGWVVETVDGVMPDDKPCRGMLKEASPRQLITTWSNHVRSQIRAREDQQEAEAARRAEASNAGSGAESAPSGVVAAGQAAAAGAAPASEVSLEESIKSEVATCDRLIAGHAREIEEAMARVAGLRDHIRTLRTRRNKAVKALKAIGVEVPNDAL